jgi:hypothetical protein
VLRVSLGLLSAQPLTPYPIWFSARQLSRPFTATKRVPIKCSRVAVLREISVRTGGSCGICRTKMKNPIDTWFRVQTYMEGSPSFEMAIITSWDSGIASLCDIRIHPWYLPYQAISSEAESPLRYRRSVTPRTSTSIPPWSLYILW